MIVANHSCFGCKQTNKQQIVSIHTSTCAHASLFLSDINGGCFPLWLRMIREGYMWYYWLGWLRRQEDLVAADWVANQSLQPIFGPNSVSLTKGQLIYILFHRTIFFCFRIGSTSFAQKFERGSKWNVGQTQCIARLLRTAAVYGETVDWKPVVASKSVLLSRETGSHRCRHVRKVLMHHDT